jgi:two-component system cell cycle response regulator
MPVRILVVEDTRTSLELMLYLLKAFGYAATAVSDGLTALERLREGEFDLVLCDVLMPGIDGLEFARRYKSQSRRSGAPLVAVTALAMVGDKERLLASGFDGYIAKPIDPETFITQIESYLPERLRFAESREVGTPQASAAASSLRGPVVLAVDDTQVNLDVVRGALQGLGCRIVEARNAREGLRRAKEIKPDVILCDLHMDGGDGFELLRAVKSAPELHDVPFFFLSSTAWRAGEQIRGLQLGARKFLMRPIDPGTLRNEVEAALAETHVEDSRR